MTMAINFKALACVGALSVAATVATAQQAPPTAPPKSSAQAEAGEPRAHAAPNAPAAASRPTAPVVPGTGSKAPTAADRLSLGTATVTGDHEQPKVMYIVPWKSSNIGDLSGKPMNSLLDEALAPVDRDEFKREVAYYDAVSTPAPHEGAAGAAARQGEK